jgi:hypothetical protein
MPSFQVGYVGSSPTGRSQKIKKLEKVETNAKY